MTDIAKKRYMMIHERGSIVKKKRRGMEVMETNAESVGGNSESEQDEEFLIYSEATTKWIERHMLYANKDKTKLTVQTVNGTTCDTNTKQIRVTVVDGKQIPIKA